MVNLLSSALAPPSRAAMSAMPPDQREKEDAARVSRQRPVLRVCSELALVGIIKDAPTRSGAEWIMKAIKDLVCSVTLSFASGQLTLVPSYRTTRRCPPCRCSRHFLNHTLGRISDWRLRSLNRYPVMPSPGLCLL